MAPGGGFEPRDGIFPEKALINVGPDWRAAQGDRSISINIIILRCFFHFYWAFTLKLYLNPVKNESPLDTYLRDHIGSSISLFLGGIILSLLPICPV
jgi:hypothetical protein